ncbi:hypothetical protein ACLOJK_021391 [Asimina triloba]
MENAVVVGEMSSNRMENRVKIGLSQPPGALSSLGALTHDVGSAPDHSVAARYSTEFHGNIESVDEKEMSGVLGEGVGSLTGAFALKHTPAVAGLAPPVKVACGAPTHARPLSSRRPPPGTAPAQTVYVHWFRISKVAAWVRMIERGRTRTKWDEKKAIFGDQDGWDADFLEQVATGGSTNAK